MAPQTQHGAIGGASVPPAEGFGSFLIHKCLESRRKGLWEPLCTEGDSEGSLGPDTNPQLPQDPKGTNREEFCLLKARGHVGNLRPSPDEPGSPPSSSHPSLCSLHCVPQASFKLTRFSSLFSLFFRWRNAGPAGFPTFQQLQRHPR